MSTDIKDIIRTYVRRQATPEQRLQVKEFILDNADNFNILLRIMREEAMKEMGLDSADDFLPELLKKRSPEAFRSCPAFSQDDEVISANFADSSDEDDIFGFLCRELLDQNVAWY